MVYVKVMLYPPERGCAYKVEYDRREIRGEHDQHNPDLTSPDSIGPKYEENCRAYQNHDMQALGDNRHAPPSTMLSVVDKMIWAMNLYDTSRVNSIFHPRIQLNHTSMMRHCDQATINHTARPSEYSQGELKAAAQEGRRMLGNYSGSARTE